ncbi:MAG: ATP synthase F0 subunit A [Verrucomicrobia bacterium]|nr:ATP synthase F0 subunit A [Verrucomicrobiota bacterium]
MLPSLSEKFARVRAGFLPVLGCTSLLLKGSVLASDTHSAQGHDAALPPDAPVLFHLGPLPVSNSMVLMWVVSALIIVVARLATKNLKENPQGLQNFVEWIVESLRDFLENILGRALTAQTFWFFASAFIFILTANWFGLIPGVGTVGWGTPDASGSLHHISQPLLRGANADLNMTLAMSVVFFVGWFFWALKANGPVGFLKHIFGPRGDGKGVLKIVLVVVFFCVGILEVVSILFRPVSLSFRLYGNVFAGETMLEAMANIVQALAPIIPIPFYFLELLVGFVQALVFTLLTAVFTLLICDHGDGHAEEGH